MGDVIKALIDGFDKITDILNIGRLLFYTAAGFCVILPAAMCLILLSRSGAQGVYWTQFVSDLSRSAHRLDVWLAALIFGFIISVLANAIFDFDSGDGTVSEQFYPFMYPRLFNGGIKPKDGANKDFAAWLISEYYRYFEIALFIPYGLMLSLPLYVAYSFIFLVRDFYSQAPVPIGGEHFAFPIWVFGSAVLWTWFWPEYWLPRVVQSAFSGWIQAKLNAAAGLKQFVDEINVPPKSPDPPKATS